MLLSLFAPLHCQADIIMHTGNALQTDAQVQVYYQATRLGGAGRASPSCAA